jgi:hypothetical protein
VHLVLRLLAAALAVPVTPMEAQEGAAAAAAAAAHQLRAALELVGRVLLAAHTQTVYRRAAVAERAVLAVRASAEMAGRLYRLLLPVLRSTMAAAVAAQTLAALLRLLTVGALAQIMELEVRVLPSSLIRQDQ